ncbi:MAG: sensor domain-containing diguanylate cyclase [Eubacteriales bacterium]
MLSREQKDFDELIEPVIWVDMIEKKIVYSNKVCENLCIDRKEIDISELKKIIVSEEGYKEAREKVIGMEYEVIIPNVKMYTYGEGIIKGTLQIMYVNEEKRYIQIQFRYNRENIKGVFLKSRCFEAIYKNSYSYPFLLDVKNRVISFIGSVQDDFAVQSIVENFPQEIIESGVIYADDIENYKKVVEKMYLGENANEVFRSYTADGKLLWYQVRCVGYTDYNDELVEVIGEFVNVQEKKELELKLYTDPLTGCMNKTIFQDLVMKELANSKDGEEYALLIIDLDNFKAINDNLGHPFGDIVLRESGEQLRKIFQHTEYVGRIGGDEFAVFTKTSKYRKRLINSIEEVVHKFDHTYKGNARKYRMTSSIGVSIYPKDGEDFESLYNNADIALYETKNMGKNGYTLYDYKMETGNMNNTTPFDVASRALSQHFDQQTIFEVFALMTEAKDYEASINKV